MCVTAQGGYTNAEIFFFNLILKKSADDRISEELFYPACNELKAKNRYLAYHHYPEINKEMKNKLLLTLFRSMEFSIQLHTNKSGWSIVYIERTQVIISPKNIFLSLKITFVAANSADPNESRIMRHFIWSSLFAKVPI